MEDPKMLPGLDRLLEACRSTGVRVDLMPPGRSVPAPGALVAGHPFDPLLASIYRRLGRARFGGESGLLQFHRLDDQVDGLDLSGKQLRQDEQEPFHSSVVFASVPGLAHYYATVPKLASSMGRQPVIYIEAYDEKPVLPIASDVDRFLDTFSHYIERLSQDEGLLSEENPDTVFPWSIPDLIARDRPLVKRLATGDFDFLMAKTPGTRKWVAQVKKAAHL